MILLSLSVINCSDGELENLKLENSEFQDEVARLDQENINLIQLLSVKEDKYLFDPYTINIGEKVLGLEILNIKIERTLMNVNYFVDFKGDLELSGVLIINMIGGSLYTFIVDEDYIKKIPKLSDTSKMYINISNDEEITRLFGDKLNSDGDKIHLKAKFDNFNYIHVPETDWISNIRFVEVIEVYD